MLWKKEKAGELCRRTTKEKYGEDGWGRWTRNKIWRGGWYLGWDGNISLLFSFLHSRPVYLSIFLHSSPQPAPESVRGPAQPELQVALSGALLGSEGRGTTSRSMGLFWQVQQQWMGIITVSLQRELAEMKAAYNVQKSPCNYLKARGERGGDGERERQWNESWWEARQTSFKVLHLVLHQLWKGALGFSSVKKFTAPSCSPHIPRSGSHMTWNVMTGPGP